MKNIEMLAKTLIRNSQALWEMSMNGNQESMITFYQLHQFSFGDLVIDVSAGSCLLDPIHRVGYLVAYPDSRLFYEVELFTGERVKWENKKIIRML